MAFFEKVSKGISSLSHDAVKKTKDLTETTKLSMQISTEENNIKGFYTEIGKLYYDEFSKTPNEKLEDLCKSVTEALNKIAAYKEEIASIKGIKLCSNCGGQIANDSTFCGVCGSKNEAAEKVETKVEVEAEENISDQVKCPSCGAAVETGVRFCSNCGSKLLE